MASAPLDLVDVAAESAENSDSTLSDPPSFLEGLSFQDVFEPSSRNVANLADSAEPQNPQNATNKFHKFERLPRELRYMVWELACFEPRIVHVRMLYWHVKCLKAMSPKMHDIQLVSNNSIPAVLHANKESRKEAQRFYKLYLAGYWQTKSKIYFHNAVDTIYLVIDHEWLRIPPGPLTRLWSEDDGNLNWSDKEVFDTDNNYYEDGNWDPDWLWERDNTRCDIRCPRRRFVEEFEWNEELDEWYEEEDWIEEEGSVQDEQPVWEDDSVEEEESVEEEKETKEQRRRGQPREENGNPLSDRDRGNRITHIERLAINLEAARKDKIFNGVQFSRDLKILPIFSNLKELTLFHEPDSTLKDNRGEIISEELHEELGIEVKRAAKLVRKSNAHLQHLLEKVVQEICVPKPAARNEELWWPQLNIRRWKSNYRPPQVKIMEVTRLPKAPPPPVDITAEPRPQSPQVAITEEPKAQSSIELSPQPLTRSQRRKIGHTPTTMTLKSVARHGGFDPKKPDPESLHAGGGLGSLSIELERRMARMQGRISGI